jgi:pyruvate ferredoxin oxidoreductase gamma subunit
MFFLENREQLISGNNNEPEPGKRSKRKGVAMKQIKIHGLGGQGVVTAAKLFCEAVAIYENAHAQAIPAYGHERRGAPVYADAIISRKPIKMKGFVYTPDYVVLFDDAVIDKGIDVMAGTSENTVFIVNTSGPKDDYPFRHHKTLCVDAQAVAIKTLGKDIPNTAMLGALAKAGLVDIEAVKQAISGKFGDAAAQNIAAAEAAGRQLTECQG